jgi:hypothetical protein
LFPPLQDIDSNLHNWANIQEINMRFHHHLQSDNHNLMWKFHHSEQEQNHTKTENRKEKENVFVCVCVYECV